MGSDMVAPIFPACEDSLAAVESASIDDSRKKTYSDVSWARDVWVVTLEMRFEI